MTVDDKKVLASLLRGLALELTAVEHTRETSWLVDCITAIQDFLRDGEAAG